MGEGLKEFDTDRFEFEKPIVFSVDRVNEMSGEEMERWLGCPYLSMSTFLVIMRRMVLEMWKK